MPKGKRLCAQLKTVLLKVYDYSVKLQQCVGTRGVLRSTLEATGEQILYCCSVTEFIYASANNVGISESTTNRLRREHAVSGTDFSSPAKRYKMS